MINPNDTTRELRQYYAAHAITGLLAYSVMYAADPHERVQSIPDLARQAFEVADAMIEAQNETDPTPPYCAHP